MLHASTGYRGGDLNAYLAYVNGLRWLGDEQVSYQFTDPEGAEWLI